MFIDRLLNQDGTPLLERTLEFTTARHRLLAADIVNADTPGYRQKDLNLDAFQHMLQNRLEHARNAPPGSVGYDDINGELDLSHHGILFHDGNNRSMEQLMTDQAKNALMHNLVVELLRRQFQTMETALKERVS